MIAVGDRSVANLLSTLAEAPDFEGAVSFLLSQLAELTGAPRAAVLRLDEKGEALRLVGSYGLSPDADLELSVSDLSCPVVVSTLSLLPIRGGGKVGPHPLDTFRSWTALPLSQPRHRTALELMSPRRASELLPDSSMEVLEHAERRIAAAPGGVIALEGVYEGEAFDSALEIVTLAGPLLSRLATLETLSTQNDQLEQQRERLTLMVDSLPDPVVITNAANDMIAQNQRAERLLHVREEDSSGRRRALELNNLLFTSFLAKSVMTAGAQAGPRELSLVDPDEGSDLLFEVLTHPLGERVGPEDAVLSVLRDVTDLRRAANELERQIQRVRQAEIKAVDERDRLDLILENVADPILVTDERSNIIRMNEQAEQLFQLGDVSTRSRRQIAAVRGNDTKFTSFVSEFALLDDDARRERMTLHHPSSGTELPVEVVSGKVKNERGEPIAIISVLHDLTKQVENEQLYEALKQLNSELEERIRAATADLAEQNARLQWQSQEVERANRLKSEFLASMSHELRTPINALIGYAALLLDGVLGGVNPQQRDALTRARAAAEHLLALINDILDLAKIEAGKMPLRLEEVGLKEVIHEVSQQMEPMVRKKALQFTTDVAAECPLLFTDRTKVKQILLNLLSNAVKFTNRGGITVEARCAPDGVHIEIVDTGIGIREQDLQAIWEDFRQVDQSRTREFGGTGLGLSITRKLLERLGGSVAVESTYGEGSRFSVFLPVRVPNSVAEMNAS